MGRNVEFEAIFGDYVMALSLEDLTAAVKALPTVVRCRILADDLMETFDGVPMEHAQVAISTLVVGLSEKHGTEIQTRAAGPWVWEDADHAHRTYLGVPDVLCELRACAITRTDDGTWIPSVGDPSFPGEVWGAEDQPDVASWEEAMRVCDGFLSNEDPEFSLAGELPYPAPPDTE